MTAAVIATIIPEVLLLLFIRIFCGGGFSSPGICGKISAETGMRKVITLGMRRMRDLRRRAFMLALVPGLSLLLSGYTGKRRPEYETSLFDTGRVHTVDVEISEDDWQDLLAHAEEIMRARAIVAIAGMEGALASVIGGLVDCPVIAVPTSVGYGASFGGVSALLSMLNACASGISVVNIDNGFGAGFLANRINQMKGIDA